MFCAVLKVVPVGGAACVVMVTCDVTTATAASTASSSRRPAFGEAGAGRLEDCAVVVAAGSTPSADRPSSDNGLAASTLDDSGAGPNC